MSQVLLSTPSLNSWEDDFLLFNFRFALIRKKLDPGHYKKVFNKILKDHSKIKVKEFTNITKIEYNDSILDRVKKNNSSFISYINKEYGIELKGTRDIYRENKGMRAFGFLRENIFYLLEIDPKHNR